MLYIFIIVFWSAIALLIVMFIIDKNHIEKNETHGIILLYPITNLFYRQKHLRILVVLIRIFSTQLLLLVVLGTFYYDTNLSINSIDDLRVNGYGINDLYITMISLCIIQIYSLPLTILHAYYFEDYIAGIVLLIIGVIVFITCAIIMTVFLVNLNHQFYYLWSISFIIGVIFDLIVMQMIYTGIIRCLFPGRFKKSHLLLIEADLQKPFLTEESDLKFVRHFYTPNPKKRSASVNARMFESAIKSHTPKATDRTMTQLYSSRCSEDGRSPRSSIQKNLD